MNYYVRLQRHSEGYTARVFEELYGVASVRRSVAEFLAEAIHHAASVTTAWSITLDPDSVRVNIGPVQLLSLWRDRVWFCTTGSKLTRKPRFLRDLSRGPAVYKSVNILSRQYEVTAKFVKRIPSPVRAAAFAYVEHAASKRRGHSSWKKAHSPGVLHFLQSYLGTELPRPLGAENFEDLQADPLDDCSRNQNFSEGALVRVTRNAFERNRAARAACLAHYGTRCSICGIGLVEQYGEMAADVVHVHHLVPLSQIRQNYKVNPVRDLTPLCPNCHTVVHLRTPPLSPEEARSLLRQRA